MKVHTLDLNFQGTPGAIAAFLLEGPDGIALIETGPASTLDASHQAIESVGFSAGDVSDVFVTHIHLDHSGAAGWWARQGSTVHVHPRGAKHLIDPSRLLESAEMVYGDRMGALWGETVSAPEENVHIVNDQETVAAAGLEITALDTAGHARHHHCFLVEDCLFSGDTAGVRLQDCDYISVPSAPPQFDPEAFDATLARLIKLDPGRLFLTHFGEVPDSVPHLEKFRSKVAAASGFVRERLEEGMDADALEIAYQAFQMEIAFRSETPEPLWRRYQLANPTPMCADGIRIYWEKRFENPK